MKIVKRLLKEGLNKEDVFAKASEEKLDPQKVSKYLAMYPDVEESEKYGRANNILVGIYSVMVLLNLIGAAPMLSEIPVAATVVVLAFLLLIPGAVIYCIYKKQAIGYLILCFLLVKGALESFNEYQEEPLWILVVVAINTCLLLYVVILKNKLFPYQNFFNTKRNGNGVFIFTKELTSKAGPMPQGGLPY